MRELKFSYIYQHDDTGRMLIKIFDIHEIELELMSECFIEGYTLIARRQHTGLSDKNGIEIYEGDLLKIELDWGYGLAEIIIEVYFKDGCFRAKALNSHEDTLLIELPYFEVIGNIYENPELLKADNEKDISI